MRKGNATLWLLVVAVIATGLVAYWKFASWQSATPIPATAPAPKTAEMVDYTSKDLKIGFQYPKGWIVDDRYLRVLLANFDTNLNKNSSPSGNQIEVVVREFSNCFPGFERDLLEPACGQGGAMAKRTIVEKVVKDVAGGKFYKYVLVDGYKRQSTSYLLVNGSRVLQISKQPDPSQHEAEFTQIVGSIRFL